MSVDTLRGSSLPFPVDARTPLANSTRVPRAARGAGVFPLFESLPVDQSLERRIRRLYSRFHSPEDRQGRSFVPLADAYRRAGDLLRARLLLEEGLRRHPDFASGHVVAMRIALDVSDHAGALAATRRVLELDPDNVEARQVLDRVGPLAEDAPANGSSGDGDAGLPDESWMAGDAGVWAAGTDSGLASVDPVALEGEEEQAPAAGAEEAREPAAEAAEEQEPVVEAEPVPVVTAEPEEDSRAAAAPAEERAATVSRQEAAGDTRRAGIPGETPLAASDAVAEAGIYTRTMGHLYEQQGLHAQAIAVYERLIESEPGDEALVSRLERLRRRMGTEAEASWTAPAAREPGTRSPGIGSAGTGAPADDERSGPAGDGSVNATGEGEAVGGGETAGTPDVVPLPGDGMDVVPIEALAPDSSIAGARGGAP